MKRFTFIVKAEKCTLPKVQKQSPRGVLLNRCSAAFQHICSRTALRKFNFKKVAIAEYLCEVFRKHAASLPENTNAEVQFQESCFA